MNLLPSCLPVPCRAPLGALLGTLLRPVRGTAPRQPRRALSLPTLTGAFTGVLTAAALTPWAAQACSNKGLDGVYVWPMSVQAGPRSCATSVQLLFDGRGRGWLQSVDAACRVPGLEGAQHILRYAIDEECHGQLRAGRVRMALELEGEELELTASHRGVTAQSVANKVRPLTPSERRWLTGLR